MIRTFSLICIALLGSFVTNAQTYNEVDRNVLKSFLQTNNNVASLWIGQEGTYPIEESDWNSGWEDKIAGVTWSNVKTAKRIKVLKWENKPGLKGILTLQGLTALEEFYVSDSELDGVFIESCGVLKQVTVKNNTSFEPNFEIKLFNCDKLNALTLEENKNIQWTGLSGLRGLKELTIVGNQFTESQPIILNSFIYLEKILLQDNSDLRGVSISGLPLLKEFILFRNSFIENTGVHISACQGLQLLAVEENRKINRIIIDNLESLTTTYINQNSFDKIGSEAIIIGNCIRLSYIGVEGNEQVKCFYAGYLPALTDLDMKDNHFPPGHNFQVADCPILSSFTIENAEGLEFIRIRRGTDIPGPLYIKINACTELRALSLQWSAITSLAIENEDGRLLNILDCANNQLPFSELLELSTQCLQLDYDNQVIRRKVYPGQIIDTHKWGLFTDNDQTFYETGESYKDLSETYTIPEEWEIGEQKTFFMWHNSLLRSRNNPLRVIFDVSDYRNIGIQDIDPNTEIYSIDGHLVVETSSSQQLKVYDMSGTLLTARMVHGVVQIPFEKGSFIVQVGSKSRKVVIN